MQVSDEAVHIQALLKRQVRRIARKRIKQLVALVRLGRVTKIEAEKLITLEMVKLRVTKEEGNHSG